MSESAISRPTRKLGPRLGYTAGVGALSLVASVLVFLLSIPAPARSPPPPGEAIIVLTGGEERIRAAARLLKEGRGKRLLISGVNRNNGRDLMRRVTGLPAELFDCCVDLGYTARNTMGNAAEAKEWAAFHNVSSLIVVTTTVHMPRSLAELGRTMPNVYLIPYGVAATLPGGLTQAPLADPLVLRFMATEYLKFLPAVALNIASRMLQPVQIGLAQRVGGSWQADRVP